MGHITAIFIVGFIVLGIYKLFELFVKKRERLTLIEKFPIIMNCNEENKKMNMPILSLGIADYYGSWALRISLLLIGIGLGCILSLIFQSQNLFAQMISNADDLGYSRGEMILLMNFAFISFMGGLGLFIAYLIESRQKKKAKKE